MNLNFERVEGVLNHVFDNAKRGDAESVIKAIDEYTATRQTMHVADKKGAEIDAVIAKNKPKALVELGGYFGYSAIRFALAARKYNPDAHYFSVEYNSIFACVIESIARFAGLEDAITVLVGDLTKTIPKLKEQLKKKFKCEQIGFLFLDHVKDHYISDLELARREGILQKGAVIVADNIIYPGAPAYRKYMMEDETKIYSSTFKQFGEDAIIISIVN